MTLYHRHKNQYFLLLYQELDRAILQFEVTQKLKLENIIENVLDSSSIVITFPIKDFHIRLTRTSYI